MYIENSEIKLSEDKRDNIIQHEGSFYQVDFLNENGKYIQGGNGIIFKLTNEQEEQDFAIKFIKYPDQDLNKDWKIKKRIKRFEREIEALSVAKENGLANVIRFEFSGTHKINDLDFQYYVMQKCDCTLNTYLARNKNELDIYQRTLLCFKILTGIKGLHEYSIYHRDIKHDNIYFLGDEPYIGDLGLAYYRESDITINERGELIGPSGWFSPEAINKYLVERSSNVNGFDCTIDIKSEVFQLGKLFWYIYQGNIPIGQVTHADFVPKDSKLFDIIFKMLMYSKEHRINSETVESELGLYLSKN